MKVNIEQAIDTVINNYRKLKEEEIQKSTDSVIDDLITTNFEDDNE